MKLYEQRENCETIVFGEEDNEVFEDIRLGDYIKYGKGLYFRVMEKAVEDGVKYVVVSRPVTVFDYQ